MGAQPQVSLVLPVHNGAAFLAAAVRSVLDQQFGDFELICVDDASSDASPAILADLAASDPRIRVVTQARNAGLPAALNTGFAIARGEYHGWTSDDNLLRPDMLARLVAVLDADPAVDIVHADYQVIDSEGAPQGRVSVGPADRLLHGNNVGAAFLYRASVTTALDGYDDTLFGAEDYDFWLRAARRFRFHALAEDLYLYRKHGGSLTNSRAATIHRMCTDIVLRELDGDGRLARAAGAGERAAILLGLATRNPYQARFDLVARAARLSPATTVGRTADILRWVRALIAHRTRN